MDAAPGRVAVGSRSGAADTAVGAGSFGQGTGFLLARVNALPERMLALFAAVALLFWYIIQLFLSRRD